MTLGEADYESQEISGKHKINEARKERNRLGRNMATQSHEVAGMKSLMTSD